jgi:hypothetical protein
MTDSWIIDDAVPPELLRAAIAEFPGPDWRHWHKYADGNAVKYGTRDRLRIPPACWEVLRSLFALPIEELTGISGTFPDVELYGAGLHLIPAGGHLGMHLDSDHHPITGWKREFSGVLFLEENVGGELVLGETNIEPRFNRLAMFRCTDQSWHGVPNPPRFDRKTLSVFWWSQNESDRIRPAARFQ